MFNPAVGVADTVCASGKFRGGGEWGGTSVDTLNLTLGTTGLTIRKAVAGGERERNRTPVGERPSVPVGGERGGIKELYLPEKQVGEHLQKPRPRGEKQKSARRASVNLLRVRGGPGMSTQV